MIILTNVGGTAPDKLQLVTSAAVTVDVHCSYVDRDSAGTTFTPGRQNTLISTAATTDICAAPGSGVIRNAKNLNVRNRHATLPVDVTIVYDANGTDCELCKSTLQPGDELVYLENVGWFVVAAAQKVFFKRRVAGSDYSNATTSFTDITGLTCPVQAGKHYAFITHLFHIENASTTGARFAVNGPAMAGMRVNGMGVFAGSLTAATMMSQTADIAALDTAVPGATLGSATTPQVALFIMSGWVNPSADGTFAIRGQSEIAVASGLVVKVGSWLQLWETDN